MDRTHLKGLHWLTAALAALCLCGPIANADETGWDITSDVLANGLQVVVVPDTRAPVATHTLWIKAGSANDPADLGGVAHFLEHLMFKATSTTPEGAFARAISDWGGTQNAFTVADVTVYFQRLPPEALRTSMEFDADRLRNLIFDDEVIEAERRVIRQERALRVEKDTASRMGESMEQALFGDHPYGSPVLGSGQDIDTITRADLTSFYNRHYHPNNALLLVVGDVDSADVLEMAEATYGQIPPFEGMEERPPAPFLASDDAKVVTLKGPDVPAASVRMTWVVPSPAAANETGARALDLLSHIFGKDAGRLQTVLVEREKIAQKISAEYRIVGRDHALFTLQGIPSRGTSLTQLEAAFARELAAIRQNGPEPSDLNAAKRRYLMQTVFAHDDQMALAVDIGTKVVFGSDFSSIHDPHNAYQDIDAAEVRIAAQRWLINDNAVTGRLVPAGN